MNREKREQKSALYALFAAIGILLNVRRGEEYAAGHLPGARSIPWDEIEERLAELPDDTSVVAYCRGSYCVYADTALRILAERGPARGRGRRVATGRLPN